MRKGRRCVTWPSAQAPAGRLGLDQRPTGAVALGPWGIRGYPVGRRGGSKCDTWLCVSYWRCVRPRLAVRWLMLVHGSDASQSTPVVAAVGRRVAASFGARNHWVFLMHVNKPLISAG